MNISYFPSQIYNNNDNNRKQEKYMLKNNTVTIDGLENDLINNKQTIQVGNNIHMLGKNILY